jgi:hypothetical protein
VTASDSAVRDATLERMKALVAAVRRT